MPPLSEIHGPSDLRALEPGELERLAREIREILIASVTTTGGHLGPNLGVVELTIALHRVFDSPRDQLVFDVGHQAYVHKLLTGRRDFSRLRQRGGLSGYPSRAESAHDLVENQHASAGLSWAAGLAAGARLRGEDSRVAVVVGDGALTGGMAWEALNNIAAAKESPITIVINDNQHSYSPTTGGLAEALAALRSHDRYEQALSMVRDALDRVPVAGSLVLDGLRATKRGIKTALIPQAFFEDLGIKYIGPVDGHDVATLESMLSHAAAFNGPVIVHTITEKGRGYEHALADDERFHQVKVIDPVNGVALKTPDPDWTSVFSDALCALGAQRADVVTVTAAMTRSTGLEAFATAFPNRSFDVGIAEQHAATSAAGMATNGLHPVVAIYSTFATRCVDQVLMDVALHRCGVTFVLDRAGITGDDGACHNGIWDLALLRTVPGIRIATPRDGVQLRALLSEAVSVDDAPTVLRYPKGPVGPVIDAMYRLGGMDVLYGHEKSLEVTDVLLVAVGPLARECLEAARRLADRGVTATVVDLRWPIPVDPALAGLASAHRLVVTVEDGVRSAGVGTAIAQFLRDANVDIPTREIGVPAEFFDHATRQQLLSRLGLSGPGIADAVLSWVGSVSEVVSSSR